jgi:hypothetical protein
MSGQLKHPPGQVDDPIGLGTLTRDRFQIVCFVQFSEIVICWSGVLESHVDGITRTFGRESRVLFQEARPFPSQGHILAAIASQGNDEYHGHFWSLLSGVVKGYQGMGRMVN